MPLDSGSRGWNQGWLCGIKTCQRYKYVPLAWMGDFNEK